MHDITAILCRQQPVKKIFLILKINLYNLSKKY